MQDKTLKLHQGNMYCSMCVFNVVAALSKLENVSEFGVDINTKTITIKLRDDKCDVKEIRTLVNQALTQGAVSCPMEGQTG